MDAEHCCPDAAMTADLQLADKLEDTWMMFKPTALHLCSSALLLPKPKVFLTRCSQSVAVVVQGVPGRSVFGPSGSMLPATSQPHAVCCRL
jgi:hypothetical protein